MASLETDNQGLMEQFEEVRQRLEKTSRASTKKLDGHVSYKALRIYLCIIPYMYTHVCSMSQAEKELNHVQEQLTKQTEMTAKYQRKSKTRKSQVGDYKCI